MNDDIQATVQVEEINIEMSESVGWVGGDSTRHYSLHGRDEPNQHPIAAIEGLREELDDIEALDVVFSNEKNQADYYLWEDENKGQDSRVGLFVTLCNDTSKIKICGADDDIFGVTVNTAAFVGGQNDVARDITYGLVVYSGIASVQCESNVAVGDYVVPDKIGKAKKSNSGYGYKVFALSNINGTMHAVISVGIPGNSIYSLSNDVNVLDQRLGAAEAQAIDAMNVANEAYNKAVASSGGSDEAINKALEAVDKADSAVKDVGDLGNRVDSINEVAIQANAIAANAAAIAETIRSEAKSVADDAMKNVNDLITSLEPITSWSDPETGNVGATYLTNYIQDGVATKVEVQTVETRIDDNKSIMERNAEKFMTLLSSVDKYSVGECSQAYGLTYEQAKSILKIDMIYIPAGHPDGDTHTETYDGQGHDNYFTEGNYYRWTGTDWEEHVNSVAFFSNVPNPGGNLRYWYIDSDKAPKGYEPRALYMFEDGKWIKVNIFYNNPNNRIVSSISQEVDNIGLEITNARGNYAGLNARLEADNKAQVAMVASVVDEHGNVNTASIVNAVNESGSSVTINGDHIVLNGATTNGDGSFQIHQDGYMIATGGQIGDWKIGSFTDGVGTYRNTLYGDFVNPNTEEGALDYRVFMRAAANKDTDAVIGVKAYNDIDDKNDDGDYRFCVQHRGKLIAKDAEIDGKVNITSGDIGGWTIAPRPETGSPYHGGIYSDFAIGSDTYRVGMKLPATKSTSNPETMAVIYVTKNLFNTDANGETATTESVFAVRPTGELIATKGSFSRDITIGGRKLSDWIGEDGSVKKINADHGSIGGWTINTNSLQASDNTYLHSDGTFIFKPSATGFVGLKEHGVNGKYIFELGADTLLSIDGVAINKTQLSKLLALIPE